MPKINRNLHQRYGKWLRLDELPIGRTLANQLIKQGLLFSVTVGAPGSKRGVRLVSADSLDDYLNALGLKQQEERKKPKK
jgi:hypothetical protein